MKIFKYSAIAAIVIAIIGIVACNKNNSETSDNQYSSKTNCNYPVIYNCYYFHTITHGMDTCLNEFCIPPSDYYPNLCYIDMSCMEDHPGPDFPIVPPNSGDSNVILCLPNYSQGSEWVAQMFDDFFANGEITFTCDCPAGTPTLMQYLPEGYLPAGTYPISKHGNDAWIDITSAVH